MFMTEASARSAKMRFMRDARTAIDKGRVPTNLLDQAGTIASSVERYLDADEMDDLRVAVHKVLQLPVDLD